MINSRLYKIRQEYIEDLQKRIEEEYTCLACEKKEVKCSIFKEKRTWEVEGLCSCGHKEYYSTSAEFRGYVIAQYKYILKSNNPDIKVRFVKETVPPSTPPPKDENPKVFKKFNFKNSTLKKK